MLGSERCSTLNTHQLFGSANRSSRRPYESNRISRTRDLPAKKAWAGGRCQAGGALPPMVSPGTGAPPGAFAGIAFAGIAIGALGHGAACCFAGIAYFLRT